MAAHALLPNLSLVHQSPLNHNGIEYDDVVTNLMMKLETDVMNARDNMRNLFDIWGLPLWVSVYLPSLILSPRFIVSGSELTGTYLDGGKGFRPRNSNLWYRVFEAAGVRVLPTSFLSEVNNAKIAYLSGKENLAAYCVFIKNQDCGACTKCLRRRLLRAAINPNEIKLITDFHRSKKIDDFLLSRPLYYGDIFVAAIRRINTTTWVDQYVTDVLSEVGDVNFHHAYFEQALTDFSFPEDMKLRIENELARFEIKKMTEQEIHNMRVYKQLV